MEKHFTGVTDAAVIAEWITKHVRLPEVRVNAVADVIAHSFEGNVVLHGGVNLVWENDGPNCTTDLRMYK